MEADSRQMKEMIRPILDREDGLMKVRQRILEKGLSRQATLTFCLSCWLHSGGGGISERAGCVQAAEEGTAAHAVDEPRVASPPEEGG